MKDDFWNGAWLGFAAFLGVMARSSRWQTKDGKFDWKRAIFECSTAPAMGVIAASFGVWQGVDPKIMGGIAALFGLLGPATLESIVVTWISQRKGNLDDEGS